MNIKDEIRNEILKLGGYEVGFFNDNFKDFQNGISFTVKLSNYIVGEIDIAPTYTYFHHYRHVNSLIDTIALNIGILLDKKGFNYVTVPASQTVDGNNSYKGSYSHKKAACLSGIGYVGKSSLFISNSYGPAVRLGTVFTDCDLQAENTIVESECNNCNICSTTCPAMAISISKNNNEFSIDPKACSDYMKKEFKLIGRGSVCGICISKCPKFKKER